MGKRRRMQRFLWFPAYCSPCGTKYALIKKFFCFDRKNAISPAGHAIIQAQLIQLAFREEGRGSYLYPKPCLADRFCGPHFFIVSQNAKTICGFLPSNRVK
jgi:hypothetical protein